jgi:hypothetical protein
MPTANTSGSFMSWRPLARLDQLVTTESGDEVLVYDLATHAIHHLNAAAATVWRHCDGHRTVAALETTCGVTGETVQVALTKLVDAGLLTTSTLPSGARSPGPSRRAFLRNVAIAGTVPVIVSISAPLAVQASSQCGRDQAGCGVNGNCCSGFICYGAGPDAICRPATCVQAGLFCLSDNACCSGNCVGVCAGE